MMDMMFALLALAVFHTLLLLNHHYSAFERESNLRAVLWGAKPAPRYWAALVLDILSALLLSIILYGLLPARGGALAGWLSRLPVFALVGLLSAASHHFLNDAIIRFPRYGMIARRMGVGALFGLLALSAGLYIAVVAAVHDPAAAGRTWIELLPRLILPAALLGLAVFSLRTLSYFLRVLPLVGDFLYTLASAALLLGLYAGLGNLAAGALEVQGPDQIAPAWGELRLAAGLVGVVAAAAALALVRLPGAQRSSRAVEPPALVSLPPQDVPVKIMHQRQEATLSTDAARMRVSVDPLQVQVEDRSGQARWSLAENGLGRELFLNKILAIPFLYTGNTIKFKLSLQRQPLSGAVVIEPEDRALVVRFPQAGASLRLSFTTPETAHLELRFEPGAPRPFPFSLTDPALFLSFSTPQDTHFLGFGQRFDRVDQRGQDLYFLVEEGGVGYQARFPWMSRFFGPRGSFPNGEGCTGFPVPFGLLSRENGTSTGLFWDTYAPSWLKTAAGNDQISTLTVLEEKLSLHILTGLTPIQVIEQYTQLNGRPNLPPAWVLLPWKTRTGAVVEADVLEDIHRFRELNIPLAQVGVEHWMEVRGSYEFSQQWYPHIDQVIGAAHENGYRITIWHFPYMNAGSATHLEAVQKGYFLRNRLGLPYQQRIFHGLAGVIDYSNPDAAAWHGELVKTRLYQRGFHGAMTDYGESVPPDCVFANGASGIAMRNAYPVLYVQAMQQAAQEAWGEDYLIYPRAGYAGSQRYITVQWPGDQDTDWDDGDGLPAAVRAMLNVSMCGFPVHGSDIGGWYDWFSPITTKELFVRWTEVGAYSPLMRAHGGPIGRNREPWKFDGETVQIYRRLSEEHVRLLPYLYTLADEAAQTGTPVVRHPALLWPACADLYAVEDAWMLGEALYAAPVVRQGLTQRDVILPPGSWWNLNAGCAVEGPGKITVESPLGRPPLFLRRGCILPRFQEVFDTFDASEKARSGSLNDPLEIWFYPPEDGSKAVFHLFDGSTLEWHDGAPGGTAAKIRPVHWTLFGEQQTSTHV
jgi:sulfoquinovosidase